MTQELFEEELLVCTSRPDLVTGVPCRCEAQRRHRCKVTYVTVNDSVDRSILSVLAYSFSYTGKCIQNLIKFTLDFFCPQSFHIQRLYTSRRGHGLPASQR